MGKTKVNSLGQKLFLIPLLNPLLHLLCPAQDGQKADSSENSLHPCWVTGMILCCQHLIVRSSAVAVLAPPFMFPRNSCAELAASSGLLSSSTWKEPGERDLPGFILCTYGPKILVTRCRPQNKSQDPSTYNSLTLSWGIYSKTPVL